MPDLEPITREEMLLDGQDLEPITRKEMFIKRIYDKTQVIPEPITREEMFLKKAGDETTDVTIEQLNVSENGTYSEEGVAYSPVIVNVPAPPIPDNAYLLNEVEGLPKDIATFSDGSNLPMPSLKVGIEPIQEGSGDPSPTNVRPISGHTEVNVTVSPLNISQLYNGQIYGDGSWVSSNMRLTNVTEAQDNSYFLKAGTYTLDYDKLNSNAPNLLQCSALTKDGNYTIIDNFANEWNSVPFTFTLTQDGYFYFTIRKDADTNINPSDYRAKILGQTYNIQFKDGDNPLTVYGGTLDVVSGVLTVDWAMLDLGNLNYTKNAIYPNIFNTALAINAKTTLDAICEIYTLYDSQTLSQYDYGFAISAGLSVMYIKNKDYAEIDDFKTAMNGVKVVYKLATPQTYQLTPTQVKSLLGSNNVWADCGQVLEGQYFSKEE